jgi:hypothetical protein
MTARTALLLHIDPEYRDALNHELSRRDYQVLEVCRPEETGAHCINLDTKSLSDWVSNQAPNIDCLVTSASLPIQVPPDQDINYPPYDIYERLLTQMHERNYGRVVNLFYGPESAQGLSVHQLKTIENRYDALFDNGDILFNSVNIGPVETSSPVEAERIFQERVDTIVWLATTERRYPHKQFFRGYEPS